MYVLHVIWIMMECHTNMKKGFAYRSMSASAYIAEPQDGNVPEIIDPMYDAKNTSVVEPSLTFDLCVIENASDNSVSYTSDVSLLFDQQRMAGLTPDNIRKYLDSMAPRVSSYTNNYSDDELLSMLKSRNIQSMSEIKAWSEYIMDTYIDLKQSAKDELDTLVKSNIPDPNPE